MVQPAELVQLDLAVCQHILSPLLDYVQHDIPLCSANPAAMRELMYNVPKAPVAKKVAVIGGGVAGMQAALTAHEAGHDVELYEASDVLGGHLNEAGSHPFKYGIHDLNLWYQHQLEKLGIPVHLNSPMDAEKIKALKPDVAVLSVGSYHFIPKFVKGYDHEKAVLCYDVLMHKAEVGQKVVVVGGGLTGSELAYDLAAYEHKDVTIVEVLPDILSAGAPVQKSVNMMLRDLLAVNNVKICANTRISAVTDEGAVVLENDGTERVIEADTVIFAIGLKPNKSYANELLGSGIAVYEVGDGKQVANIQRSTSEAYEVTRML